MILVIIFQGISSIVIINYEFKETSSLEIEDFLQILPAFMMVISPNTFESKIIDLINSIQEIMAFHQLINTLYILMPIHPSEYYSYSLPIIKVDDTIL